MVRVSEGAEPFDIDKTEVTVDAYAACVKAGACTPPDKTYRTCNGAEKGSHPVNCVDWIQSTAYCAWAGKRLPTEQEWEYAAGGAGKRMYPWGEAEPEGKACLQPRGKTGTCPAGSYPAGAGPFGTLDMAGNVKEWTSSVERLPGGVNARVFRGGGWENDPLAPAPAIRVSEREFLPESAYAADLGFRCAAKIGR